MEQREGIKPEIEESQIDSKQIKDILHGDWETVLETEEYETSAEKLTELKALNNWRRGIKNSSFRDFFLLSEHGSNIIAQTSNIEAQLALRRELTDTLAEKTSHMPPRIADLYSGLLSSFCNEDYKSIFESTAEKINQLKEEGDLDILFNPNISYEVKLNRIKTRLIGDLTGRKALDRRDKNIFDGIEINKDNIDDSPPPAREESKPSMDEQERSNEWEKTKPLWTISPAFGGYFREQCFNIWDKEENKWRSSGYNFEKVSGCESGEDCITISAILKPGVKTRLPIPYNFDFSKVSGINCEAGRDQNGDFVVINNSGAKQKVEIILNKLSEQRRIVGEENNVDFGEINISQETVEVMKKIISDKKTAEKQARAMSRYVRSRLIYSSDSSFNRLYDEDERGYIGSIDHHRQADCDVANTYFAALCSKLNIPVRHVVGHMVKGKNKDGNSMITGGTGHAWSEIFDRNKGWIRIDATPSGDPQMEDDTGEEMESCNGDYGEEEAIASTDEELLELEKMLADHTEKLSYTEKERELAEAAGVELKEARKIVKEIDEAEDTRLPNGKKVVDLLSQVFNLIIESRKTKQIDYTGPVRRREGGEAIQNIVAHKIGIAAKDFDPSSRQKPEMEERVEEIFDGLDVYIVGDKSGSMSDTFDGEAKWRMQRKAEYLIFSSLYRFGEKLRRTAKSMSEPMDVRTMALSFRDSKKIDVDKPLSSSFSAEDKVKLWHSLGNQGSGNGDVEALSQIYGQIKSEIEDDESRKNRLRVIFACSDGMPDSPADVQNLARQLGEINSIVVGIGMTETASQVPVIFDTEYSRGDIAKDISDLPAIVAKHVIMEATKLFPERIKKSVNSVMKSILDKFH